MGYSWARRYTNKAGKKHDKDQNYLPLELGTSSDEKAKFARIFWLSYKTAELHPVYARIRKELKKAPG